MITDNYLKYWRLRAGLDQSSLADRAGVNRSYISQIESGTRNPSTSVLCRLAEALDVRPGLILDGPDHEIPDIIEGVLDISIVPGGGSPFPGIPLLADIPAGPWREWVDDYPVGVAGEYVPRYGVRGEHIFAIRVDGDSMVPSIYPRDILIINPEKTFTNYRGGIGVVKYRGSYKIRKVFRSAGNYHLVPANPAYDPELVPVERTVIFKIVKRIPEEDWKY